MQPDSELFQIVPAGCPASRFASLLHRGKQQCDQNRDDRNDDQQFDQCEASSESQTIGPHSVVSHNKHSVTDSVAYEAKYRSGGPQLIGWLHAYLQTVKVVVRLTSVRSDQLSGQAIANESLASTATRFDNTRRDCLTTSALL
jgi:hypothetical protein